MTYTPTDFIRYRDGETATAYSWSDHYQFIWEGYSVVGAAPPPDPHTLPASKGYVDDAIDAQSAADIATYARKVVAYVDDYGSDPTGVNESSAAFNSALAALPVGSNGLRYGKVVFGNGVYKVNATAALGYLAPGVTIEGAGRYATLLNDYGFATDLFRQWQPIFPASGYNGITAWGGGIKAVTIDGTNNPSGCAIHYGDIEEPEYDVAIQNYLTGTALHEDNTLWWTEKAHVKAQVLKCGAALVCNVSDGQAFTGVTLVSASGGVATFTRTGGWNFTGPGVPIPAGVYLYGSAGLTTPATSSASTMTVTSVSGNTLTCAYTGTAPSGTSGTLTVCSATQSHGYGDYDITAYLNANQSGIVVKNGSQPYHGSLRLRANCSAGATNTGILMQVTGQQPTQHPGATKYATVYGMRLEILAETGTGTVTHQSFNLGTPGSNLVQGCYGIVDLAQGAGNFVNANFSLVANSGSFLFSGPFRGDNTVNPANGPFHWIGGPSIGAKSFMSGSNGNTFTGSGDYFQATLSANITVNLGPSFNTPSGATTVAAPQRKVFVIIQAGSGGPYTVTWPHNASPTTSAPKVVWAGGAAPTMTATAGAVDVYLLHTIDGVTWYGQALQNVS